jgi:PAS domain S-box-containing protein
LIEDIGKRKQAEAALHESEERLRLVVESLAEGVVVHDAQGRLISANRAARQILGLGAGDLVGKSAIDPGWRALREDGSDWPADRYPAMETLRTGEPLSGAVMGLQKPDGTLAWLSLNTRLLPGMEASATRGVVVSFADVTAHRSTEAALQRMNAELERRVVERTQALEQANREMQSFSYSVSHDLRAPLRVINGFSRILLADGAGKFDPETLDHLGRIAAGAERMGRLIDDLINLSRVSRTEMRRQAVNLSQLAASVAKNLAQAEPQRQVEILIAPDMMVDADPGLLQIVLENLLGNAWKFTSRTDGARVEVGWQERDGEIIRFVRDNGAGFDMRHAGKLFGAFQRLHSQREFEGTGIGLSIVQRIVVKHGGRIWAEAKPGAGAAIYFTLASGARTI